MFCWQPSHQSKQHPIYPNRSIQNTSDTNSACCCAGWSWKLRKDFKAKWNREIMVISNRNIIFQIPFWGSRIDLGDVNVRQLDPFKRLGSPLYSLPGSLSGDSSGWASEPSRLLKLWPYHLPSTWGGRTVLSCYLEVRKWDGSSIFPATTHAFWLIIRFLMASGHETWQWKSLGHLSGTIELN